MYSAFSDVTSRWRSGTRARTRIPATILLLGMTSMLTDISSEMVTAVLPLYLTYELSFSALAFGAYVGLAEGVQAVVRIAGGAAADRRSGHKRLAVVGYATSALSRIGILAAGGAWAPTTGVLLADRAGKGIRTAPRDALISFASPPDELGRSFGVHRSLDALGALLGPLVAFAILATLPDAYDAVFVVSFSIALIGLAVLVLFVRQPRISVAPTDRFRSIVFQDVIRSEPLRRVAGAAFLLGMFTIGDAFVFLGYRRVSDIRLEFFPLLFTGVAVVFLGTAVPIGRLADRIGRRIVFLGGYIVLALVYVALVTPPPGVLGLATVVCGLGVFYASTDGVLMAAASDLLGVRTRATGLAVVATGTALGRLVAAVVFGALWTAFGAATAFLLFAAAIPIAVVVSWRLFASRPRSTEGGVDLVHDHDDCSAI